MPPESRPAHSPGYLAIEDCLFLPSVLLVASLLSPHCWAPAADAWLPLPIIASLVGLLPAPFNHRLVTSLLCCSASSPPSRPSRDPLLPHRRGDCHRQPNGATIALCLFVCFVPFCERPVSPIWRPLAGHPPTPHAVPRHPHRHRLQAQPQHLLVPPCRIVPKPHHPRHRRVRPRHLPPLRLTLVQPQPRFPTFQLCVYRFLQSKILPRLLAPLDKRVQHRRQPASPPSPRRPPPPIRRQR